MEQITGYGPFNNQELSKQDMQREVQHKQHTASLTSSLSFQNDLDISVWISIP